MALTSTTAKQLCTKAELSLFTESLARNIKALDGKGLRARVTRARRLRDKYHALANRQDREARGKQPARRRQPSQGSVATRKKEQLFAESLARFEQQLAKLEAARSRATQPRSAKRSTKKATARKPAARKSGVKKTAKAKPATKKSPATAKAKKKAAARKSPAKKKAAATSKPSPAAKAAAKKKARLSATRKKAAATAKKTKIGASGLKRKQKHLSAVNRRQQARRDAK